MDVGLTSSNSVCSGLCGTERRETRSRAACAAPFKMARDYIDYGSAVSGEFTAGISQEVLQLFCGSAFAISTAPDVAPRTKTRLQSEARRAHLRLASICRRVVYTIFVTLGAIAALASSSLHAASDAYGRSVLLYRLADPSSGADLGSIRTVVPNNYPGTVNDSANAAGGADSDAVSPERRSELRALVAELEALIEAEELANGPYAASMSESLTQLARSYDELGQTNKALSARERAMFLIRVNEGLNSPTQRPLLRTIISQLREQGNYQALDDRYRYFFRIHGSGRAPWTDSRWNATLEYLAWEREALLRDVGSDPFRRLVRLVGTHESLGEALDKEGARAPWNIRVDAALSHLDTLYMLEEFAAPYVERRDYVERIRPRNDPLEVDRQLEQVLMLQRTVNRRGRALIDAALELVPAEEHLARARLELAAADWSLWHGSTVVAMSRYRELLRRAAGYPREVRAEIEAWFDSPMPLPHSSTFAVVERPALQSTVVSIAVTSSGRGRSSRSAADTTPGPIDAVGAGSGVSGAEAVPTEVRDSGRRSSVRLLRALNSLRYRPAFVNGEPVEATIGPVLAAFYESRAWRAPRSFANY